MTCLVCVFLFSISTKKYIYIYKLCFINTYTTIVTCNYINYRHILGHGLWRHSNQLGRSRVEGHRVFRLRYNRGCHSRISLTISRLPGTNSGSKLLTTRTL